MSPSNKGSRPSSQRALSTEPNDDATPLWRERGLHDGRVAFKATIRAMVEGADGTTRDAGSILAAFLFQATTEGDINKLARPLTEMMQAANNSEWMRTFYSSSSGDFMLAYQEEFLEGWGDAALAFLQDPAPPQAYLVSVDEGEDLWRGALYAVGVTNIPAAPTSTHQRHGSLRTTYVVYPYCVSVLLLTFRMNSSPKAVPAGANRLVAGLPFALVSLLFGWWGIPWGPIYTVQCLYRWIQGGIDVTAAVEAGVEFDRPPIAGESWGSPSR